MKIEQFRYGMFNGKIQLIKSPGVSDLIGDKNFQFLRGLTVADSDRYIWFPKQQVVAVPHIEETADNVGRRWVVNHTLLIRLHDYLRLTNPAAQLDEYVIKGVHGPESLVSLNSIEVKPKRLSEAVKPPMNSQQIASSKSSSGSGSSASYAADSPSTSA